MRKTCTKESVVPKPCWWPRLENKLLICDRIRCSAQIVLLRISKFAIQSKENSKWTSTMDCFTKSSFHWQILFLRKCNRNHTLKDTNQCMMSGRNHTFIPVS
jgi:hypothetical protein